MNSKTQKEADELFAQAKSDISADMRSRDIGAIIWDTASADFHYLPNVDVEQPDGKRHVEKIMGIYRHGDGLYLIEQGKADVSIDNYYTKGVDVRPVVVTLTERQARDQLGSPIPSRGYTDQGDVEEWLTVADCYFEALTLDNDA